MVVVFRNKNVPCVEGIVFSRLIFHHKHTYIYIHTVHQQRYPGKYHKHTYLHLYYTTTTPPREVLQFFIDIPGTIKPSITL